MRIVCYQPVPSPILGGVKIIQYAITRMQIISVDGLVGKPMNMLLHTCSERLPIIQVASIK